MGVKAARLLAAGVAVAADRVLGEPPAAVHPVGAFGNAMAKLEKTVYRDRRDTGVVYVGAGVGAGVIAGVALRRIAGRAIATLIATEVVVAGRMLADAAREVQHALDGGDLDRARQLLPVLVGRDPSGFDAAEVARAAVESVAENTVDAVMAPAMWAVLAGAPGALAYRAVNTLDAMVGHHSARYERFGWAAARIDDIANWLPARATAVAVALARPHAAGAVWRAVRRDAPAHPSPNAGVAEAAFAAVLGVELGGRNVYGERVEFRPRLGTGRRAAPADIDAAVGLARDVTIVLAGALIAGGAIAAAPPRRG
jgi:adenosylcobinamide-phosphate synthase